MAKQTKTRHLLSDQLTTAGPLDADAVLALMQQLVEQVAQLHQAGQLQRIIGTSNIWIDPHGQATWQPAPAGPWRCSTASKRDQLPPELETITELLLPARIDQAEAALKQQGASCNPRRIDLFQLGQLALELLAGEQAAGYLMSPQIKAAVPAPWREWIDLALGYSPDKRAESCEQLEVALQKMIPEQPTQATMPTPPVGTGIDVQRDTPLYGTQLPTLPFTQLGHYRIDSKLGSGGMGDVYQGYDTRLDRSVAIKVLPQELAHNEDFVQRFMSEARGAAQLVHPNIVPIYFIGEDEGTHFFAMQLVDGPSLADLLKQQGALPAQQCIQLIQQVATGLSEAHAQGLIHRDIKPGNILIDGKTEQAKLADFGLVKSLGSSIQATATGVVMGTVDYISPEQGRGQAVDERTDLYSLGVLFYHVLSGQLPFVADSPTAMIFQHAYEQPTPLAELVSEVPVGLARVVECLMQKNPDDRYRSAAALIEDLQAVREGRDPRLVERQTSDNNPDSSDSQVILASKFDDIDQRVQQATEIYIPQIEQGWRTRLLAAFNQHAPQGLKDLQNTQQQVDGGIAIYTQRRNEIAALAAEARTVEKELSHEITEQQTAVQTAEQKGDNTQAALHRDTLDLLNAQLEEQKTQTEQIDLRLARVDTTLQKLRSQQQLLVARLETAQAGMAVSTTGEQEPRLPDSFPVKKAVWLIAFVTLIPVASLVIWSLIMKPTPTFVSPADNSAATTPAEMVYQPGPTIYAWDDWLDLLPAIDPQQDPLGTSWVRENESLTLLNSSAANRLTIPVSLNGSYEMRFQYSCTDGALRLALPLGQGRGILTLGTDDRGQLGCGISGIAGKDATQIENPTVNPNFPLSHSQSHKVSINVRLSKSDAHVRVSIDDLDAIDWQGPQQLVQPLHKLDRHSMGFVPTLVGWHSKQLIVDQFELKIHNGQAKFAYLPTSPATRHGGAEYGHQYNGHQSTTINSFSYDGSHPLTIEAWLVPEEDSDAYPLVLCDRGNVSMLRLNYDKRNRWSFGTYNYHSKREHTITDTSLITWGQRTHVAGVYHLGQLELFVDGRSVGCSEKFNDVKPSGNKIRISTEFWNQGSGFQGIVEQVRVTRGVRYQSSFQPQRFERDDNTMALYDLNEGVGNLVYDSSGNGHHGIARFATWVGMKDIPKVAVNKSTKSLTGTWQINFPSGAQRAVTLNELPDGTTLLRAGGVLSGRYRRDGDRLVVKKPDDKRYQGLAWQFDGKDFVLVEEPPNHPSGQSYVGTRMKSISSDTSKAAQSLVKKLPSSAKNEYALNFDDHSRYILNSSFQYDGTHPLTVEAWLAPRQEPQGNPVNLFQSSGVAMLQLLVSERGWAFHARDYQLGISKLAKWQTPIPWNQWTHVTGIYHLDKIELFVNGKRVASSSVPASFQPQGNLLRIGSDSYAGDSVFHGKIGQVRISRGVRYQKDFQPSPTFASDDNTMALYRLNEGKGYVAIDSSGNGHHGTIRAPQWSPVKAAYTAASPETAPLIATVPLSSAEILTSGTWQWTKPKNLGSKINTQGQDRAPFISADELTLLYASTRAGGQGDMDLWITTRQSVSDAWEDPENLGAKINSDTWDSQPSMTADGLILVFESRRQGGIGDADIYMSTRKSASHPWEKAIHLGETINSTAGEWEPAISYDGLTLSYYADRPHNVGGEDIWIHQRASRSAPWGKAVNLGPKINSRQGEGSPRLLNQGRLLLLNSDRSGTLGLADIWLSTRTSKQGSFRLPINLGAPINSQYADGGAMLSPDLKTLWFNSRRPGGIGGEDIWYSRRVPHQ